MPAEDKGVIQRLHSLRHGEGSQAAARPERPEPDLAHPVGEEGRREIFAVAEGVVPDLLDSLREEEGGDVLPPAVGFLPDHSRPVRQGEEAVPERRTCPGGGGLPAPLKAAAFKADSHEGGVGKLICHNDSPFVCKRGYLREHRHIRASAASPAIARRRGGRPPAGRCSRRKRPARWIPPRLE